MSPAYLGLWAVFWHPQHLWLWQSFLPLFQGLPWAPPNIWCGSLDLLPPLSGGSPSDEEMSLLLNGSRAPTSLTVLNYFASWFREYEGLWTWFFEFEYEMALVPRDLPFPSVLQTTLVTCQAIFFPLDTLAYAVCVSSGPLLPTPVLGLLRPHVFNDDETHSQMMGYVVRCLFFIVLPPQT